MTDWLALVLALLIVFMFAGAMVIVLNGTIRDGLRILHMRVFDLWMLGTKLREEAIERRDRDKRLPSLPWGTNHSRNVKAMKAGERWEWDWQPPMPGILRGVEITVIVGRIEALVVDNLSIQHVTLLLPAIQGPRPAAYFQSTHPLFPKVEGLVNASLRTFMELYAFEDLIVLVSPIVEFKSAETKAAA